MTRAGHPVIPDAALSQHTAVVAQTGAGKSYATRGIVERLLEERRRVCVVDYTGVWWGLRSSASGKGPGYPVVIFGGEHGDVPLNEAAAPIVAKFVAAGDVPSVIDLDGLSVGAQQRFVTAFLEELYRLNSRPLHLVIEEIDEFAPQTGARGTERMIGAVARIFQRGRKKGFRAIAITQRPANTHKRVLAQCKTLIALRLVHPLDIAAIEDWIKGHGDPAKLKSFIATLASLDVGLGIVWAPDQDILEGVKFPPIRTFDSMRAPEEGEPAGPARLAEVDLPALRAQMGALVQEAEANDPAKLKAELAARGKRILELERAIEDQGRELAAAESRVDSDAIKQAELRGHKSGVVDGANFYRDLAALTVGAEKALRYLAGEIANVADRMRDEHARTAERLKQHAESSISEKHAPVPARPAPRAKPAAAPARAKPNNGAAAEGLTPARQRILDALAWMESLGTAEASRSTIAFLADASPESSAYANNLGALRTAGLIEYPGPGAIALTDAGRRCANRPADALTHHAIMEAVRGKLTPAQVRILDAAVAAHSDAIAKERLAEIVGASASSSAFANNLGRLRTLGLITYPAPGQVRADDRLFP